MLQRGGYLKLLRYFVGGVMGVVDGPKNLRLLLLLLFVLRAQTHARNHRPRLDHHARTCLFRRGSIRRAYRHRDTKLAFCLAFVNAAGGRDVRVVASYRYTNVAIATDQIVRGVKRSPS